MRKALSLLLALVMCLTLCACTPNTGHQSQVTDTSPVESSTEEPLNSEPVYVSEYIPKDIREDVITSFQLDLAGEMLIENLFRSLDNGIGVLKISDSIPNDDLTAFSDHVQALIQEFSDTFDAEYEIDIDKLADADKAAAFGLTTDQFELTVAEAGLDMEQLNYLQGNSDSQTLFDATIGLINLYSDFYFGESFVSDADAAALAAKLPK